MAEMDLTKEEVELIKRKRKEEADYKKMMSEKPIVYTGKGHAKIRYAQERIKSLRKQLPKSQKCSRCPNPLFDSMLSSDAEPYRIGNELVCRECYFDELGEMIEKHPIGIPRRIHVF